MKKCLYCNELIADKQEYCNKGHRQSVIVENVPEVLKELFRTFDNDKENDK